MCYNQTGDISPLDGTPLKLVDKFTYLRSSVSSTEKDIDTRLTKEWIAINRLSIIWKLDLTDKMKRSFFQAAVVSTLLYGCTTWTITKRLEKKLDGNYTRMLRAILNKSWRQHPTRHQLYGHLPATTKTIQVRRTRHAGHCWRSRNELISDVLLWTPTYGRAKAGRLARTYIQQLCEDTGCSPEDLPEAMNDREKWRERVRDICASGTTWWWWWWWWLSGPDSWPFSWKPVKILANTGPKGQPIETPSVCLPSKPNLTDIQNFINWIKYLSERREGDYDMKHHTINVCYRFSVDSLSILNKVHSSFYKKI